MKHSDTIQPIIGSIIQARKAKNLSQSELGRRLGLPQSYISRLESGRLDIRLSGALEIARYLGLEMMLVPCSSVPTINLVVDDSKNAFSRPLYNLDDLEGEDE